MKPGEVNEYLLNHPDQEITWKNLFNVIPAQAGIQD
jgi:hypothetical protein